LQESWVGGIMPLAGLVGGISGGPLIEYLGRKNTILLTAPPFIAAWLLIACANSIAMVLSGNFQLIFHIFFFSKFLFLNSI
jgi:facilitated trehalose transporter